MQLNKQSNAAKFKVADAAHYRQKSLFPYLTIYPSDLGHILATRNTIERSANSIQLQEKTPQNSSNKRRTSSLKFQFFHISRSTHQITAIFCRTETHVWGEICRLIKLKSKNNKWKNLITIIDEKQPTNQSSPRHTNQ